MASCSVCHFLTRSMFRRAPEPVGDSSHARGPGSVFDSITDELFSVRPAREPPLHSGGGAHM